MHDVYCVCEFIYASIFVCSSVLVNYNNTGPRREKRAISAGNVSRRAHRQNREGIWFILLLLKVMQFAYLSITISGDSRVAIAIA